MTVAPIHDRRYFLAAGAGVAAAALLAACGDDSDTASDAVATTSTAAPNAGDLRLLTLAASIEELEVAIYKQGLDSGAFKANREAAKILQAHHDHHAGLFDGHVTRLGGTPSKDPHPALLAQVGPRLTDESGVLRAALDVAQIAAATYQLAVETVSDKVLKIVFASVAGVEARHAAYLGTLVNQSLPAAGFAATDKAVKT